MGDEGGGDAVAYIAVGSNIDPEENICRALDLLSREVRVEAVSTFYQTAALERPDQPDYRNGVFRVRTDLPPRALKFDVLRGIESALGRVRTEDAFAAREIDLDIAVYGAVVVSEADLVIPDPEIRERAFIAAPLLEVGPELVLADTGERLASLPVARGGVELREDRILTDKLRSRLNHES